jgi:hypothetical protein
MKSITSLGIPHSVEMINGFANGTSLTAVNLSAQRNLVQLQGFGGCAAVPALDFPDNHGEWSQNATDYSVVYL